MGKADLARSEKLGCVWKSFAAVLLFAKTLVLWFGAFTLCYFNAGWTWAKWLQAISVVLSLKKKKKKRSRREGKRKKKMTLSCESYFPVNRYAFSSMPYKHSSVLTLTFAIWVLGNIEGDLSNGMFWLLAVALWSHGGVPNLKSAIRVQSTEDFLGCHHALGWFWTPSTCIFDAVLVVLTTNIWRVLIVISKI